MAPKRWGLAGLPREGDEEPTLVQLKQVPGSGGGRGVLQATV